VDERNRSHLPPGQGKHAEQAAGGGDGFDFARLSERQQAILRLIVQEYVASGRPVGSKVLADRHALAVSSATIRHEMADLEAAGYVQHLHTSGGRVPTDAGYRYIVHHLLGDPELIAALVRADHDPPPVPAGGAAAGAVVGAGGGGAGPRRRQRLGRDRAADGDLAPAPPGVGRAATRLGLLILVTAEGSVRQAMVHWPKEAEQEVLSPLADALAADLRGLASNEVAGRAEGSTGLARFVIEQTAAALRGLDAAERRRCGTRGWRTFWPNRSSGPAPTRPVRCWRC
jgi:heat-inducible transcriptional repressor